ncbi:MAG: DNA replication and repair protein RecF, partial [Clostridia bacterium]|nr:DNA replication and repair protein RecF [Clostridia bacterium]
LLETLTVKLAEYGQQIVKNRVDYTARLQEKAVERYDGLSGGREQLSLVYEPSRHYESLSDEACREQLKQEWDAHRRADIETGFTTVGPHREDLQVRIDGRSARLYGSQGQQRSAVLSLKLAEAAILRETTGKRPAVLLDDVMSELDASRQAYIVNQLAGWQVFVTCCDPTTIWGSVVGKRFHVKHGTLTEEGSA